MTWWSSVLIMYLAWFYVFLLTDFQLTEIYVENKRERLSWKQWQTNSYSLGGSKKCSSNSGKFPCMRQATLLLWHWSKKTFIAFPAICWRNKNSFHRKNYPMAPFLTSHSTSDVALGLYCLLLSLRYDHISLVSVKTEISAIKPRGWQLLIPIHFTTYLQK